MLQQGLEKFPEIGTHIVQMLHKMVLFTALHMTIMITHWPLGNVNANLKFVIEKRILMADV